MFDEIIKYLTNETSPEWLVLLIPFLFVAAYFKSNKMVGFLGIFLLSIQSIPRDPTTLSNVFNFFTVLQLCLLPFFLRKILFPKTMIFIVLLIFMSTCQTGIIFGFNEDVLSSFRRAISFPFFYLIAYNTVKTKDDLKIFIFLMAFGTFFQSCRQIVFAIVSPDKNDLNILRTFQFISSGMVIYPISILLLRAKNWKIWTIIFIPVTLIALALTQTRSMWMPELAGILSLGFIYRKEPIFKFQNIMKYCLVAVPIILVFFLIQNSLLQKINIFNVVTNGNTVNFTDSHGRTEDIGIAFEEWIDGNVILGNGLGYSADVFKYPYYESRGHVGYFAYLTNMGIIGLFVFGFLFPYERYKEMNSLLRNEGTKSIGAVMSLLIIFLILEVAFSGSLLWSVLCVQVATVTGGISGYFKFSNIGLKFIGTEKIT